MDRHAFVDAGKLLENERVLLYNGETKRVVSKLSRPGPEIVYNFEVHGEHVYHVTPDGVLVHNECVRLDLKGRIGQNKSIPRKAYEIIKIFAETGKLPKNFYAAHAFNNVKNQLPRGGKYVALDIIRQYPQRGVRRIVVDLKTGKAWYTNNHYKSFRRM